MAKLNAKKGGGAVAAKPQPQRMSLPGLPSLLSAPSSSSAKKNTNMKEVVKGKGKRMSYPAYERHEEAYEAEAEAGEAEENSDDGAESEESAESAEEGGGFDLAGDNDDDDEEVRYVCVVNGIMLDTCNTIHTSERE
jgi:hypothetical protein